jgi:conjugative transfer signal peptidase TraF
MRPRILVLGGLACLLLAAPVSPRLMWNATASVPVGLYRLAEPATVKVGDLVVVRPDPILAASLARDGWLPRGVPLLKPVAAIEGQVVCRHDLVVNIDGQAVAVALPRDAKGRVLPRWSGCRRLEDGEVFVLAAPLGSFDGRYFGPTPRRAVIAVAHPVWTPIPAPKREGRR